VRTLVAQAVAELHLGRTDEAKSALDEAVKREPEYAEAIANLLVLNVIIGKDPTELIRYVGELESSRHLHLLSTDMSTRSSLKKASPDHTFLTDLEEKSALFDKAATKYSPKVSA